MSEETTAETQDAAAAPEAGIAAEGPDPRKRGLGRGLNALFEDEEGIYPQADPDGDTPGRARQMMGTDQIAPRADQPRQSFDEETLKELAASIKQYGVLQPLLVRPAKDGGPVHEIIAGERRWRASQIAQIHEVPVIILDVEDEEAYKIAMIENLQREDLNPVDEANGYHMLVENFDYTQEKLADSLGKSRSYITNMMRLRKLPEFIQNHLAAGSITTGHARALLAARDPAAVIDEIIKNDLSVRDTEKLVAGDSAGLQKTRAGSLEKSKVKELDVNITHLEQSLSVATGLNVNIKTKASGKAGRVEIEFKSLDQLDEVLRYITLGATGSATAAMTELTSGVAPETLSEDEAGESASAAAKAAARLLD